MYKFLFTNTSLLVSLFSLAQVPDTITISGIMLSANNNKPIPYGTVKAGNETTVMTDSTGHFTITSISKKVHTLSFYTFAYAKADTTFSAGGSSLRHFIWKVYPDCWQHSIKAASTDIRNNERRIYVQKGVAPVLNSDVPAFEKKYSLKFLFNNITDVRWDCMTAYNKLIFKYLDSAFGKGWRKEVNEAVLKSLAIVPKENGLNAAKPKEKIEERQVLMTVQSDVSEQKYASPPMESELEPLPVDEDNKIFLRVENEAQFPGGDPSWTRYLQKNIGGYNPLDSGALPGKYTVVVKFIVSKDGTVSDVKAETSHGYGMEQKAIQIIKTGPKWMPAIQNGKSVNSYRRKEIIIVAGKQ